MSGAVKSSSAPGVPASAGISGFSPNAPSITLPLRFVLAGLVALCAGVCLLIARPETLSTYHYNQHVVAVTHLFVLGWICTVVMGSMYQLVPVALEARLYSEKLAGVQFAIHVVGVAGMVWMFWSWNMKQVGHFGSLLTVGILLFVYNIGRTLLRVPRWNVTAVSVASSLFWLTGAVLAGLTIVAGKCAYEAQEAAEGTGFVAILLRLLVAVGSFAGRFDQMSAMHGHAHLGAVGVFLMLIMGISYKLVPMFALSEIQNQFRAWLSVALLNLGLLTAFFCIVSRSALRFPAAFLIAAALVVYAVELAAILRARKRRALDWGLKSFLVGIGLLLPVGVLGLALAWPKLPLTPLTGQVETVYGFLALAGVVSMAILGMFFKIIPFLVWYGTYSRHIGRSKVPSLSDLYSVPLQLAWLLSYTGGLTTTCTGILLQQSLVVRIGSCLIAASLGFLLINIGKMLSHFAWPRMEPMVLPGNPAAPSPSKASPAVKNPQNLYAAS